MGYKHNKEDIITAGAELFRQQGYHKVGINDILKSSGIPKGSFYNFFESKEDFAIQALDQYADGSLQLAKSLLQNTDLSPLARIKSFYQHMIEFNQSEGCKNGCLINNMSVEVGGNNDRLSEVVNKRFLEIVRLLAQVVEQAQEAEEIRKDQKPEEIAEYLHSGFFGALSRMKVNRTPTYLNKWFQMTFDLINS